MRSQANQARYDTGLELGKAAFERGIKCAPVLDPALNAELGDDNLSLLNGWLEGWTSANLKGDVQPCDPNDPIYWDSEKDKRDLDRETELIESIEKELGHKPF